MAKCIRAKNKVEYKLYFDKDLKEDFKHYATKNDTNMAQEITKFIESYVNRAKKQEQKSQQ